MTDTNIARRRLINQQLAGSTLKTPAEMVRWFGAVQSQDYLGGKWAIGLRTGLDDPAVEAAIEAGEMIRLHVLRPTWHFVHAEDARWMIALTGPRVKAGMAGRLRELGIDEATVARSEDVFRQVLAGGKHLTRDQMEAVLNQAGVSTSVPQSLVHLLSRAELDGVICSGATQGKQFTYALADERLPQSQPFEREAALAELARRYFASHGPATLRDYTWWSGLTVGDARTGIDLAKESLWGEEIDGLTYWSADKGLAGVSTAQQGAARLADSTPAVDPAAQTVVSQRPSPVPVTGMPLVHLLPNYDEYVVAYADRSAVFDPVHADKLHMRGGLLNNVVLINGMVVGGWKREFGKKAVKMTIEPLWGFTPDEQMGVEAAAQRYGAYWGLPVTLDEV